MLEISVKKKKIEAWVTDILACHLLLVNPELSADDVENTVKVSAMITIGLPVFVALWTVVALFSNVFAIESFKVPFFVAVIVTVFGVSSITDKIYDRNTVHIQQRAEEIKRNSEQGVMWARRRLFKIYLGNAATIAAIVTLIKLVT